MTVKDIIHLESGNQATIILLREGIFWKAYEKSAFAFFHQVHPYKPIRKWVQTVKGDLISLGFPMASTDSVLKNKEILLQQEDRLVLSALPIVQEEFESWKQSVSMTLPDTGQRMFSPASETVVTSQEDIRPIVAVVPPVNQVPSSTTFYEQLVESIRFFNLESKTPVECMLFLMELKRKIAEQS